jgi:hypothetical protein
VVNCQLDALAILRLLHLYQLPEVVFLLRIPHRVKNAAINNSFKTGHPKKWIKLEKIHCNIYYLLVFRMEVLPHGLQTFLQQLVLIWIVLL